VLSDRDIQKAIQNKHIGIEPEPDITQLQPATIDLRLGAVCTPVGGGLSLNSMKEWVLLPGEFWLGSTLETVTVGRCILGQVHGKSTRARQGLIVHAAGLIDPGFSGQLTLEMFNMSAAPIILTPGMLICQISFCWMSTTPDRVYGEAELLSRYQHQAGPTKARP
jgi:dCTP deaminase